MSVIKANDSSSLQPRLNTPNSGEQPVCTIHVCTSCRERGTPRGFREDRPGFILYRRLREAFSTSTYQNQVDVMPAECLSICPRPCGIALSMPGSWTYLFGDQEPDVAVRDILELVAVYFQSHHGFMARENRPKSLRRSILGRVPPLPGRRPCI